MGKRIIVCIDGTNNSPTEARTNVSRFMRMVAKTNDQIAYYQPGVGTLDPDRPGNKVWAKAKRLWDLMTAWQIARHAQSAYRYLMDVYHSGDAIYLIGFSRGAYTCRVLGGMLTKVGLLHRGQQEMVPFAWKLFAEPRNDEAAGRFKKYYSRDVSLEFLGVWDTVRSVGTPWRPKVFPFTRNNPRIRVVRHAMALDERRVLYPVNLWTDTPTAEQDVQQVWFPGVHADIGGGYAGDTDPGIGAIPLAWMTHEARLAGIEFSPDEFKRVLWRKDRAAPKEITVEEVTKEFVGDDTHDEIKAHWHWRLAEAIPLPRWKPEQDQWRRLWAPHHGRPRTVLPFTKLHHSIRVRMQTCPEYRPINLPQPCPEDRFIW